MMLALFLACTGEPDGEPESATPTSSVAPELLALTWQVRMADAATRAPYEQHPGWALLFTRDLDGALGAFTNPANDGGGARVHLELAALYRQAARVAAEATLQVYGEDRQDTDPADVDYLVGVSKTLLGKGPNPELAATPIDAVFATRAAGWRSAAWPPLPALALATSDPSDAIHPRDLPERTATRKTVQVVDPTELVALALWHEREAIRLGAPARWLDPWRFPLEPRSEDTEPIADGILFAGFLPASQDVAFLAAACGGTVSLDDFPQSVLANALAPAIVAGHLDVPRIGEAAEGFADALTSAMVARAGQAEGYQRAFADIGRLSVLRAAVCVADDLGQVEDAGLLRVEVADRSNGPERDPVFLLSLAAWDASHRNAVRSLDLLHAVSRDYPQLELARVPLDAMSVRLSRNGAPAAPVH
jgi:hypothetical protein